MMNTCDGCKHWRAPDSTLENWAIQHGERLRILRPYDALGACDHPKLTAPVMQKGYGVELSTIYPDGLVAENDEGWGFVTAPKFGCVHWEAKA